MFALKIETMKMLSKKASRFYELIENYSVPTPAEDFAMFKVRNTEIYVPFNQCKTSISRIRIKMF